MYQYSLYNFEKRVTKKTETPPASSAAQGSIQLRIHRNLLTPEIPGVSKKHTKVVDKTEDLKETQGLLEQLLGARWKSVGCLKWH